MYDLKDLIVRFSVNNIIYRSPTQFHRTLSLVGTLGMGPPLIPRSRVNGFKCNHTPKEHLCLIVAETSLLETVLLEVSYILDACW